MTTRPKLPGQLPGAREDDEVAALIHHSDRGSQYASTDFQKLLDNHDIVCSMSRKGNCYDNATAKSSFGTLKTDLNEPLGPREIAPAIRFDYIEVFDNRQRPHSTLSDMFPAAYEEKHYAAKQRNIRARHLRGSSVLDAPVTARRLDQTFHLRSRNKP